METEVWERASAFMNAQRRWRDLRGCDADGHGSGGGAEGRLDDVGRAS